MRFKRLERLRARLEELGDVAEEPVREAVEVPVEEPARHEPREVAVEPVRARSADSVRGVAGERARKAAGELVLGRPASPRGTRTDRRADAISQSASAHALGGRSPHVDDPPR